MAKTKSRNLAVTEAVKSAAVVGSSPKNGLWKKVEENAAETLAAQQHGSANFGHFRFTGANVEAVVKAGTVVVEIKS